MGDLLVYVRAVHFAATIVAAGAVIFEFAVAAPAFALAGMATHGAAKRLRLRWAWIVWASLAAAVLSGAIWLVLLAADIYGAPIGDLWSNGGIWTVATETRFGQIWTARFAAAVLLAGSIRMWRGTAERGSERGPWGVLSIIFAVGFLIGPAWIGHAGATPGGAGEFSLAADAVHLLAAGAWLGSLPPLAMLLAAAWREKEPSWAAVTALAVRRFSLLGLASVGALLASGIVNSWYEVGSLGHLITTAYGELILVKLGLLAAIIAIAAVNRLYLTPRLATAGTVSRLQQNSVAETVLGFAAIVVVGFLGAMAPASHTHQHPSYRLCSSRRGFRSHSFARRHGRCGNYSRSCRQSACRHSTLGRELRIARRKSVDVHADCPSSWEQGGGAKCLARPGRQLAGRGHRLTVTWQLDRRG
ncbi:MAG TPA: CopD family protein [Xanthobacteraceae bacterium]|nr:CopD family protein [Xanthobacteraceae bacterium]